MKKFVYFIIVLSSVLFITSPVFAQDTLQLAGRAHVQDIGWIDTQGDGNHLLLGTQGQAKRIEAITLRTNDPGVNINYQTHVQDIGWQSPVSNGSEAGTQGQSKRIECFVVSLTGPNANKYSLYYRTHVENYGWLDWASSGQHAGTAQHAFRCEAIEFLVLSADSAAPGKTTTPAIEATCREESRIIEQVNYLRRDHGLSYLTGDPNLRSVAIVRLNELPTSFSHTRPNGKNFNTAVKDVFPSYRLNAGGFDEIILFGVNTMADPVSSYTTTTRYPHEVDKLLEPSLKYLSWAGMTRGTMGYSVTLLSGLDRIDFAD